METSHIRMHLGYGSIEADVSVFPVLIVDGGAGLILEDNSVGFNVSGGPLEYLCDTQNLAMCFLDFYLGHAAHVVPELCLGNNVVAGENPH